MSCVGPVWWRRAHAHWDRCCRSRTAAPAEAGWTRHPALGRTAETARRGESDTCTTYTPLYLNASSKLNIFHCVPHKKEIDLWANCPLKHCPGITCWAEVKLGLLLHFLEVLDTHLHHFMIWLARKREICQYTPEVCAGPPGGHVWCWAGQESRCSPTDTTSHNESRSLSGHEKLKTFDRFVTFKNSS